MIVVAVGQRRSGTQRQRARNGCKHGAVHNGLLTVKNSKKPALPRLRHREERRTDYARAHEGAEVNATASLRIPLPRYFFGCSTSFCTRQLSSSATYSTFSDGHAISWIQPNCLSCLPASPSTPSTFPSSDSLYT